MSRSRLLPEEATVAHPYTGDFFRRSTLSRDWGACNELPAKGVTASPSRCSCCRHPDLHVMSPTQKHQLAAREQVDTAVVLDARLQIVF